MPAAEAGDTRQLLIFLDQGLGFPGDFLGRNLNLNFPLRGGCGFGGAHVLSVRTEGEKRQTPQGTLVTLGHWPLVVGHWPLALGAP